MMVMWTGTVLAGPWLVRYGIDHGINEGDAGALNAAVAGYVVVAVLAYVTNRIQITLISRVGEDFLRRLRILVRRPPATPVDAVLRPLQGRRAGVSA